MDLKLSSATQSRIRELELSSSTKSSIRAVKLTCQRAQCACYVAYVGSHADVAEIVGALLGNAIPGG